MSNYPGTSTFISSFHQRPPLKFHNIHGEHIILTKNNRLAKRTDSYCKALVFGDRPIAVDEIILIRFPEVGGGEWSGGLRFGVTNTDPVTFGGDLPKYVCPEMTNKEGTWAKAVNDRYCQKGHVMYFVVQETGEMYYGVNGSLKGLFLSGINTRSPMFVVMDVYGKTTTVEFVDDREQPCFAGSSSRNNNTVESRAKPKPIVPPPPPSIPAPRPPTIPSTGGAAQNTTSTSTPATASQPGPSSSSSSSRPPQVPVPTSAAAVQMTPVQQLTRDLEQRLNFSQHQQRSLNPAPPSAVTNTAAVAAAATNSTTNATSASSIPTISSTTNQNSSSSSNNANNSNAPISAAAPIAATSVSSSASASASANLTQQPARRSLPDLVALIYNRYLPLTPMQFHPLRGRNVTLNSDRTIASRASEEYCNGYVFTSRPIRFMEKVVIQMLGVHTAFNGGLAFGVTNCDPSELQQQNFQFPDDADELLNRPEFWAVNKEYEKLPSLHDEMTFYINENGELIYQRNNDAQRTLMHVDTSLNYYMFFDIYGRAQCVRCVGTTDARSQPPAPPAPSIPHSTSGATSRRRQHHSASSNNNNANAHNHGPNRRQPPAIPPSSSSSFVFPGAAAAAAAAAVSSTTGASTSLSSAPPSTLTPAAVLQQFQMLQPVGRPASSGAGGSNAGLTVNLPPQSADQRRPTEPARPPIHHQQATFVAPPVPPPAAASAVSSSSSSSFSSRPVPAARYNNNRYGGGGGGGNGPMPPARPSRPPPPVPPTRMFPGPPPPTTTTNQSTNQHQARSVGPMPRPASTSAVQMAAAEAATSAMGRQNQQQQQQQLGAAGPSSAPPGTPAADPPGSQQRPSSAGAGTGTETGGGAGAGAECSVCMDNRINCAVYPCGHMCMCYECGRTTWNRQGVCPICRQTIQDILKLFPSS